MVGERISALWAVVLLSAMWAGCLQADAGGEIDVPEPGAAESSNNATDGPTGAVVFETTASWTVGVTGCGTARVMQSDGVDHVVVALNETAQRHPFRADFAATAPAEQYKVSFFDGSLYLESFRTAGTVIYGWVPAAATQALMSACGGAGHEVSFVVTDGSAEGPDVIQHGTTHWRAGVPGCVGTFYSGTDGYDHGRFYIANESADQAFEASFVSVVPGTQYGLSFFRDLEHLESFESAEPAISGRVPAQATEVIVWSCGGGSVTLDFVVRYG